MEGYWFKRQIQIKVYRLYLKGVAIELIAIHLRISEDEVNAIIDYVNEIYH